MTHRSATDRARILQRRAAFLGSTLAALGCSAQPAPPTPDPVVAVPVAPHVDTEAAVAAAPPPPPPPVPASGDQPSLQIPDDLGEAGKRHFEQFAGSMRELYQLQDEMAGAVPEDCDILSPTCDQGWQRLASLSAKMRGVTTFTHHCPGSSTDAKRFAAFEKEHRSTLGQRQAKLEGRIGEALASGGDPARQRWEEHQREAYAAKPIPCLSIRCVDW